MSKKYTVEQYTITRRDGGKWDDQSDRDVTEFDSLDEAKSAYGNVDVRAQWIAEKSASSMQLVKSKVMAVELCENALDDNGDIENSETLEYAEYGLPDYEKEQ